MSEVQSVRPAGEPLPRTAVYAAFTISMVVLTCIFGKEMAWDVLHYHFYAGFSALNDRFSSDYFAAGAQSYFNPFAYVPFYALVQLGLPDICVSMILAAIQSVLLWITFEIACIVCPSSSRRELLFFGLFATVLTLLNPILLQQIGSSFADITTAELVLAGWLLLARAVGAPTLGRVTLAAALLGIAVALKPTNAVHAFAAFFILIFLPVTLPARVRSIAVFGSVMGLAFALTSAPWSYKLAKAFGNPVFPLLNNVFKSPEFTTASLKHYRFVPDCLSDALLRPFSMLSMDTMVHDELAAPDIRYALLLVAGAIFAATWIYRHFGRGFISPAEPVRLTNRPALALGSGLVIDWVIWLSQSGNSRYFLPMASIAAVLATALLYRLLGDARGRHLFLLALLAAQAAQACRSAQFRWDEAPWGGHWFNVEMPENLARQPNLYLSIGMQSNSFIVPFLARGSGAVNFFGSYALGPTGTNATHVLAMIKRSGTHIRVLMAGDGIYPDGTRREPRQSDVDEALGTFGLRVDLDDCQTIRIHGLHRENARALKSSIPAAAVYGERKYDAYLTSCHVIPDLRDRSEERAMRREADVVLDRLEDACPTLFQPPRPQTQHQNGLWFRAYSGTDLLAWIGHDEVRFTDPTRETHDVLLGPVDQWLNSSPPITCGRRHYRYLARIHLAPGTMNGGSALKSGTPPRERER